MICVNEVAIQWGISSRIINYIPSYILLSIRLKNGNRNFDSNLYVYLEKRSFTGLIFILYYFVSGKKLKDSSISW